MQLLQQTQAVVIKVADHGESDKIVTTYCPDLGKLTGIAKGAKRSKKRFVNKLEPYSYLNIEFAASKRSGLVRIDQAELLNPFPTLRTEYERFSAAALVCELILHWTKENDADRQLFYLLVWTLENLNSGKPWVEAIIFFQLKLFTLLGYQPHLEGCMGCGSLEAGQGPYRFSLSHSGLTCAHCNKDSGAATLPLALNTAKLLRMAQDLPNEKLARLRFSKASAKEALLFLRRYGTHLLQRELQSWNHLGAF